MANLIECNPTLTANQILLDLINRVYSDGLTSEEATELRLMINKSFEALDEWK